MPANSLGATAKPDAVYLISINDLEVIESDFLGPAASYVSDLSVRGSGKLK